MTMALIITLLALGASLLFLQALLPGLIAGVIGFLCLVAAVVLGYQDHGVRAGNLILGGVLMGWVIGVLCWLKRLPGSRIATLWVSRGTVGERGVARPELLHRSGVALTQLRPSGTAFINGNRVDVVTEGTPLEPGAVIKVMAVEGARVVVREV